MKVLLADLSHVRTGSEWSVLPMPINMGYLSAFASAYYEGPLDIRICKSPEIFISTVEEFTPDVIGFSNYIWNANLATAAATWARQTLPDTLIVMGGPNVNTTEPEAAIAFLASRPAVDFYIPNEGEVPFLRLLTALRDAGGSRSSLLVHGIEGTWRLNRGTDSLNTTSLDVTIPEPPGGLDPRTGRLLDLDDIPSPYLSGVMDDFLAQEAYVPLIETNRGCPYSCTFCAWGDMSKSKSASFPVERVHKELDFIAESNRSRVSYLYIGDANFGLFQRDVEIADHLRQLKDIQGFPEHVYLYFAKNSSKRVLEIARTLRGMTPISLSRQTQNPEVLANIKRSNIDIDTFNDLSRQAKSLGVDSFVELIYALPGESLTSFLNGVREVLDSDVDGLHFFPAMLLAGSEMATAQSRHLYELEGQFRAIDGASGDYGPFAATEFEEIVTRTSVFSRSDYLTVRRFHLIQSILIDAHAGGRLFYGLRALTGGESLYPLLELLARGSSEESSPFWRLLEEFAADSESELMSHEAAMERGFTVIGGTPAVKLNPYYLTRLLFEDGRLEDFLSILSSNIVDMYGADPTVVDAVLEVIRQRIYPFDGSTEGELSVGVDLARLMQAALLPKEVPFGRAELLGDRVTIPVSKVRTYAELLHSASDRGLDRCAAIYDVALHHSRDNIGLLYTWSLDEQSAESERTIANEGGWLY